MTEDEMVGWHHWPNGHEFEQASGDGEGQGSLACCSPMGLQSPTRLSDWINKKMFLYLCFPSLFLFQCHNIFLLSFPFALHSPLFPLPPFLPPSFFSRLPLFFPSTCLKIKKLAQNLVFAEASVELFPSACLYYIYGRHLCACVGSERL